METKDEMMKMIKRIRGIVSAFIRILRTILEILVLMAIIVCIFIAVLMAIIAEASERLFAHISSALTALIKSLGNRLMKENT